jgi:hemolysin III
LILLPGWWRWGILGLTWSQGVIGMGLCLAAIPLPPLVATSMYLIMGWGFLLGYFAAARVLTPQALRLAWIGGLIYTVGAAIHLSKWPVLYPGVFEAHELFHLFAMAGSAVHFWFMLRVVGPFEWPGELALAEPAAAPAGPTLGTLPAE